MNQSPFAGQVALVTGASTGIGRAVALALGQQGAQVGVNYCHNPREARAVVTEIQQAGGTAMAIRADVSQAAEVQALFATLLETFDGRLDLLINNAGQWMERTPLTECSEEIWQQMIDVNLKSVFLCCRAAVPIMAAQRSGVILNTCSVAGHTGGGGTLPYAAAKAGVITFTRGLARELAPLGIRVNGVSPGVIDTPMQHLAPPGELFRLAAQIPLKRVGVPEEVVGAFLFLASPQAAYITGEIIEVNGGLLMH